MKTKNQNTKIRKYQKQIRLYIAKQQTNIIKCLILPFYFLPLFLMAQEKTVWVKSVYTPLQEFLAWTENSKPQAISYANYLLKQKREFAKNFQLKQKLLTAQELYLLGEEERAIKSFKQISNLAYQADWDKEDRRILIYSFLRMAQLKDDPENKKALLLLTSDFFASKINKENYSDYNLFPPPLMEKLQTIQKKKNNLSINWNKIFPDHEFILLNGKKIEKNKILSLPQAIYKITALSSSHTAWSKNISLSELVRLTIKTQSLTRGSCRNQEILMSAPIKNIKLAPISHCPKLDILNASPQIGQELTVSSSLLEESQKETSSSQNLLSHWPSWLVIGAGVIALSLAISLGGEDSNKTEDHVY